ncbi:BMC domain-containing protein [Gracilibacillus marinus]
MTNALGLLEVLGFSVALYVMDQACKQANITIQAMDCNNPINGDDATIPVVVQVKFTGSVSDVQVALDVAKESARMFLAEDEIVTRLISSQADGLEKLIHTGKVQAW